MIDYRSNLAQIIKVLSTRLATIEDKDLAQQESYFMLSDLLNKSVSWIRINKDQLIADYLIDKLTLWLENRLAGMPLTHATGIAHFWNHKYKVTADTLAPRAATESILEQALAIVESRSDLQQNISLLDLGTGSGAIIISLVDELLSRYPAINITAVAVDQSLAALEIAKLNCLSILGNEFNSNYAIDFRKSDWYSSLPEQKFDIIISNPPYIDPKDPHIAELLPFEPKSALVAENCGLADLQIIIENAAKQINKKGYLIVEHGNEQGSEVAQIYSTTGCFKPAIAIYDLAGHFRGNYAQIAD